MHGATSRQGKRGAVGKAKHGRGTTGTGSNASVRKKSKLVVTFDPDKRREYLTGFHKRKQERRRFGLDMEAYKVKKRHLEAKKQRREEQMEKLAGLNLVDESEATEEEDPSDSEDSESESNPLIGGAKAVTQVTTFNDDFTQTKFGDVVTVTTSVGDLYCDESDNELKISDKEDDGDKANPLDQKKRKVNEEQHLTLFQRIQLQRKGKALPSKRSKIRDARTARKNLMNKMGGNAVTGKKRGLDDNSGASASSKLNKMLKMKRQGGGKKRRKSGS